MTGSFSDEALAQVEAMFAEGQKNPLEGTCGQRKKREAMKQPRTPLQAQADRDRAQAQRGKSNVSSSVRSEAAKRAAATRAKCKGGGSTTGPSTPA
jgi:hypothetical protein